MSINKDNIFDDTRVNSSRRRLLAAGGVIAAASLASAIPVQAAKKNPPPMETQMFPKFYPLADFQPEVSVAGKFIVITGASRGIGRATGEALLAAGASVIGTSRDARAVVGSPFPLLDLDITSPASIAAFVAALQAHGNYPGSIDALINNAGRFVFGTPTPIDPTLVDYFNSQVDLAMDTLYGGHVRVTNALLGSMSAGGSIMFTTSVAAYGVGGTEIGEALGQSFLSPYYSGKRALLAYANNLRGFMRTANTGIRVATVNPFAINTPLAEGTNPIALEPVDPVTGNSLINPTLNLVLDGTRALLANGLPASDVADTYVQLLQMNEPTPNVAVGSDQEPKATQGANELLLAGALEENQESAATLGCAPPGKSK